MDVPGPPERARHVPSFAVTATNRYKEGNRSSTPMDIITSPLMTLG